MGVKAVVGPDDDELRAVARLARHKLRTGQDPDHGELEALRLDTVAQRPALRVIDGDLEPLPGGSTLYPEWGGFLDIVRPLLASVGRIDRGGSPVGTAFLVRPRLLATNRHVAEALLEGSALAHDVVVHFELEEPKPPTSCGLPVWSLVGAHRKLDVALLELGEEAEGRVPIVLASKEPSIEQPVATIGYPFPDETRNALFLDDLFPPPTGVERVAPGDVEDVIAGVLWHDCSTLAGNSGSPVIARDTGEVIGLHFDGAWLTTNKALPAADVAEYIAAVWRDG